MVTGTSSQTACRQCVEAGPGEKTDKVLEIYRNEAAVQPTAKQGTTAN